MRHLDRRREMMGVQTPGGGILYQLASPVTQALESEVIPIFDTEFKLLETDRDWTITSYHHFSYRDEAALYNLVTNVDETNTKTIANKADAFYLGQSGVVGAASRIRAFGVVNTTISGWAWSSAINVKAAITHVKGSGQVHLFAKMGSTENDILTNVGTFVASNYTLRSKFAGTLYDLTVYDSVLSETECLNYIRN